MKHSIKIILNENEFDLGRFVRCQIDKVGKSMVPFFVLRTFVHFSWQDVPVLCLFLVNFAARRREMRETYESAVSVAWGADISFFFAFVFLSKWDIIGHFYILAFFMNF